MIYRPEIDGLRAVAVLPVILFHAGFNLFQGGFVGVDIFFVISGYLITRIIITEIYDSNFKLINFYERRARRILPALFLVIGVTFLASWFILTPIAFKDFGQSLFSVSVFSSNFFFWWESGYFDIGTDLKPLIHTWSLSLEEQFYIFFPLLASLIYFMNPRALIPIIFLIFITSLSLAEYLSSFEMHADTRHAAFFLLHTRAWELLLGSIIFLALQKKKFADFKYVNNSLSLVGLILIIYSIIFFNDNTPFPSFYTLIPTIGAGFIIIFAAKGTFVYRFLTLRPMIFVGLISYSAYLWHQPILAISRHFFVGALSLEYLLIVVLSTLVLAYLTWRFVEKPFRNKSNFSRKKIFTFSIIGSIIFAGIGLGIHFKDGFKGRFSEAENDILSFQEYKEREEQYRNRVCFLRSDQNFNDFHDSCVGGGIVLWGDSHAAGLSFGLRKSLNITQLTSSGCPPILHYYSSQRPNCKEINKGIFELLDTLNPDSVILLANWISPYYESSLPYLKETIQELSTRYPDINFFFVGGIPQWAPSLPVSIVKAKEQLTGDPSYIKNELFKKVRNQDQNILRIITNLGNENLRFISLLEALCKDDYCLIQSNEPKIEPISFDYAHLTGAGSVLVSDIIKNNLN